MQVDNDDLPTGKSRADSGDFLSSSATTSTHQRHHILINPQHDCMSPLIPINPKHTATTTTAGSKAKNTRGVNLSLGFNNGGNNSLEGIATMAESHQSNLTCCTLFGSGSGSGSGSGGGGGNHNGGGDNRPLSYLQHICGASSQRTDNSYPPQGQGLGPGLGQGFDQRQDVQGRARTESRTDRGGVTGRSI